MLTKTLEAYREGGAYEVLWRVKRRLGLLRKLQIKYHLGRTINSVYGVKLACNFEDRTFRMYVRGTYGRFYWEHLTSIRHPFIFVDIGVNQGLYTLCAARNRFNKKSYSFEPNGKIFELLEENIKLNKLEGKCAAYKLAISNATAETELMLSEGHSGGASLAKGKTSFGDTSVRIETINHKQFDMLLGDNDMPVLVKVDVEGFEKVVLRELMKSKHVGKITEVFYEVDEQWVNPQELQNILEVAGFKHFDRKSDGVHYDVLASR